MQRCYTTEQQDYDRHVVKDGGGSDEHDDDDDDDSDIRVKVEAALTEQHYG